MQIGNLCLLPLVELIVECNLTEDIDFLISDADNRVPCRNPGLCSRITGIHICYNRFVNTDHRNENYGSYKCKNKIKYRTCGNYRNSCPHRLIIKIIRRIRSFFVLSHSAKSADRKESQGVFGSLIIFCIYQGSHSYRELFYVYSIFLCQCKMSQFMKEYDEAENQYCKYNPQVSSYLLLSIRS